MGDPNGADAASAGPWRGKHPVLGFLVFLTGAAVLAFLFLSYIPWLTAHPISQITARDNPTPPPPSWARAFTVNHGAYFYFREGPEDNPTKRKVIVAGIGLSWAVTVISMFYLLRTGSQRKKRIRG